MKTAEDAFKSLNPNTINDTFLSLQKHMECCMSVEEGNNFKEPHMDKARGKRAGEDIETFICSKEAYNIATAKLEESE